MKFLLPVFFSISWTMSLPAQNYIDILKINANTGSVNKFDTSSSSTRLKELAADLTYPIRINDNHAILTGLTYETIQTKLFANQPLKTFSSVCLKAGLNKTFSSEWSGTFVLLPKMASDFEKTGRKDFQLGGLALMKFKKNENLTYKFGLYYNSELFGPFFVPMLGMYYLRPDKKLEISLMLPIQADINYKIVSFINAGANFNGQTRSYHLNSISGYPDTYVTKSTNELFAYLKFNLGKSFSILTKLGQSVGRTYRVYDENDKVSFGLPSIYIGHKRQILNSDFSDGLIYQVVLLYRFNL